MDGQLDLALKGLQLVLWIVVGVYTWQQGRHRATREHVERVERAAVEQQRQIDVLTERMAHVPTAGQVADLTASVRELVALFRGISGKVEQVDLRLNRIEDFLHGHGRG